MRFDAIVLSGGRAARLGGTAKAAMLHHGVPLLVRAADAASDARYLVVVGDGAVGLPERTRVIRESPPYSGPAAALGAGLRELDRLRRKRPEPNGPPDAADAHDGLVLVLACDMPNVGPLVAGLLAAATASGADGAVAVDRSGRRQPLAAVYRHSALERVVRGRDLVGMSMRDMLAGLRLHEVPARSVGTAVPTTDPIADVDSWADAARLEVEPAPSRRRELT